MIALVVEDHDFHAALVEEALRREGYAVHRAGTRVEALERLAGHGYDLVIADLRLPDTDSADAWLADLRAFHPGVLVLATGAVDPLEAVTTRYRTRLLIKPYSLAQLLSSIRA